MLQPTGSSIGTIEFDATIELAHPSGHFKSVLFVRYWVSAEYYHVAVEWAEPNETELCLPLYSPSLYIASNSNSFLVHRSSSACAPSAYQKPVKLPTHFAHMLGDFPAADTRFAEGEAMRDRVTLGDVLRIDGHVFRGEGEDLTFLHLQHSEGGEVARVGFLKGTSFLRSLELYGKGGQLIKSIDYYYGPKSAPSALRRQTVYLPERKIMAVLPDGDVTLKVRGKQCKFNAFPMIHEKGGRCCTIDYENVTLGRAIYNLPSQILVQNGADQKLIRSAILRNFRRRTESVSEIAEMAHNFAEFKPADIIGRRLIGSYRKSTGRTMSNADYEAAKALRDDLIGVDVNMLTVGGRLKHQNTLMGLSFILGDESAVMCYFEDYLAMLADGGAQSVILLGGQDVLEAAILKGKWQLAYRLLELWGDALSKHVPFPTILRFATVEITRGKLWEIFLLLNHLTDRLSSEAGEQFERSALMCLALDRLLTLSKDEEVPDATRLQRAWCFSSMRLDTLHRRLATCLKDADELEKRLGNLSDRQSAYKKLLERISRFHNVLN